MKKRLLACLLAVAMVLSFMPFSAFAADAVTVIDDTATPAITVGENYYVFDADDFAGKTFTTTLPADEGIDADAVAGTQYIGVRIKIDDKQAAYYFQNSRFQVFVKISGTEYRIDGSQNGGTTVRSSANWFVDYTDASLTKFFNAGGVWSAHQKGIETTGSLDGVMLFPISNNTAVTEAALAEGFEGITFTFYDEAATGNVKASNWDNKTVYIGDVSFVDDYDAYYEAYIKTTGNKKYTLNDGSTAKIFTRVNPFRSYYRNHNLQTPNIGTHFLVEGDAESVPYSDTSGNYVVHTVILPNGDRATALKYNTEKVTYYTLDELNASLQADYEGESTAPTGTAYNFYNQDAYRHTTSASDSRVDAGAVGLPKDANGAYELDISDVGYIVYRIAIHGGNENAWVQWRVSECADGSNTNIGNGNYEFIDANTGEITMMNFTSSRFTTTGSIDGYLVVPTSSFDSFNLENVKTKARYMSVTLVRGFYDGKTMYVGNSYFVDDITKFKASLFAPDVELETEADDNSITITNADGTLEYSIDGETWNTTGAFTGLTKDTQYTISVRYKGFTKVATHKVWTSPYSTHIGDTASYLMNVYDEPTEMWGSNNGNGVNSPIHYASNDFATDSSGTYGNNQCIKVVADENGETFIELDMDEAKLTGNKQIRVYYNAFEDLSLTSQLGVSDLIDTTDVEYLAYRMKITGGEDGTVSKLGICWGNGTFPLQNLEKAFAIDYETGNVYTPESWTDGSNMNGSIECLVFDGEFDGWIVLPFDCIKNSSATDNSVKDIILGNVEGKDLAALTGVRDIQFNFYHNGTTTDWTNRNLYVGDVLVLEDAETFAKVRGCDKLGNHSFETKTVDATCTEDGYTVEWCECGVEQNRVVIDALGHSEVIDAAVAPTHTENGLTEGSHCSRCGEVFVAQEDVPALGHTEYDEGVVTAPTCTEGGYTTYTCSCGHSYKDNYTDALGHSFVDDACSVCGELIDTIDELKEVFANGGSVKLYGDIELGEIGYTETETAYPYHLYVAEGKTVTLDLNGHSLTSAATENVHVIFNHGTLNIIDSVGGGKVWANAVGGSAVRNFGGAVTINGGEFGSDNCTHYTVYTNGGTLDIETATVDSGFGCVQIVGGAVATIKGGTYNMNDGSDNPNANQQNIVYVESATLTINDGEFDSNISIKGAAVVGEYASTIVINGGYYNGPSMAIQSRAESNVTLTAGEFVNGFSYGGDTGIGVINNYLEEGTEAVAVSSPVSTFALTAGTPTTYYVGDGALAEAYEKAADGDIISILTDISITNVLNVGKTITIDLNGNTLSVADDFVCTNDNQSIFTVTRGGYLTMEDSVGGGTLDASEIARTAITVTAYGESETGDCATLIINGGKYIGRWFGIAGNGGRDNTYIEVNGGELVGVEWEAIYHPQDGEFVINGGTFSSMAGCAIAVYSGSLSISGGTFNGTTKAVEIENIGGTGYQEITSISITGGTFNAGEGSVVIDSIDGGAGRLVGFITGGTYNATIDADLLADGFDLVENGDGTYSVVPHVCDYTAEVTAPTCTEKGYTTYTCSCGDSYVADEVAALGHSEGAAVKENIVEATLNSTGSYESVVYCSVCGVELSRTTVITDKLSGAVAAINGYNYATLAEAVEKAANGDTIVLLKDAQGAGVVINKSVTIDFGGHTYSFTDGVGSTGTPSNGFQILKGNTVVLKNGKLEVAAEGADKLYILIQNYADLTITDMVLDGTNLDKWALTDGDSYVLSVNSGNVVVNGNTSIIANNDGDLAYAFDSFEKAPYTIPTVTLDTTGTITGNIEVTGGNIALNAGTINGELVYDSGYVTKADEVALDAPEGYEWVDGVLTLKHVCDYTAVVTAPTCTEKGYTTYTCAGCGDSYVDNYVDALGHSYSTVVTAPTCTDKGYTTYTCSVCGESYVDNYVDALGHSYDAVVTAPTCIEQGYTTYTCSVCGDSYVSDYTDVVDHDYEVVVVAPTKTNTGYKLHTCTVCGDVKYTDPVSSLSGVVQNVTATPDSNTVTVTWDALTAVNRYIVYIYNTDGEQVKCAEAATNKAAFVLADGDYAALVIAKTNNGWYRFLDADEVPFTIVKDAPEVAPGPSGSITDYAHDYVTITWDAVDGATKYTVMIVGGGETIYRAATGTSVSVYGLKAGTEYTVSINAKVNGAYTGYGSESTFTTAESINVTLNANVGVTRISFSWSADNGTISKIWLKSVVDGTTTQLKVVDDKTFVNVRKASGDYYIIARVVVDGVATYVTSNTITVG